MIQITVNPDIISKLKEHGFFPDTMLTCFMVLKAMDTQSLDILDTLDDNSSSRRALLVYHDLLRKGLIQEEGSETLFSITPKGKELVQELLSLEGDKTGAVEKWFDQWMNLWPSGVNPTGSKLLRSDEKECLRKMVSFVKEYKFGPNTIIQATKRYLAEAEERNWAYTKAAVYFIHKRGEGSELAARCEQYLKEKEEGFNSLTNYSTGLI